MVRFHFNDSQLALISLVCLSLLDHPLAPFFLTNLKGNHQKFSKLKAQIMRTRGNSAKGLLRWDKLSENYKFYSMVR